MRVLTPLFCWVALAAFPVQAAVGNGLALRVFHSGGYGSVLMPGSTTPGANGVSNYTASVPGEQGSDPMALGYGRPPIASWNVPQFMTVTAPIKIGVVAFKPSSDAEYNGGAGVISNISYVDFNCDGGPPAGGATVRSMSMTMNDDSDTVEYWVELDPENFSDGLHECQAVVVPTTGIGKGLQGTFDITTNNTLDRSLFITTNKSGTYPADTRYVATTGTNFSTGGGCGQTSATPCANIGYAKERIQSALGQVGGGLICVAPGTYSMGMPVDNQTRSAPNEYLTVDSCGPGGTKENVILNRIDSPSGLRARKLRLQNVTWDMRGAPGGGGINNGGGGDDALIWAHNVTWIGPGRHILEATQIENDTFDRSKFFTNVTWDNVRGAVGNIRLLRNSTLTRFGSDAITSIRTGININIDDISPYYMTGPGGWGAASRATANGNSGSNVLTNVSNFYDVVVNGGLNFCDITYMSIVSFDVGANTITTNTNCASSVTAADLYSGAHADVSQYENASFNNIIQYGITVTNLQGMSFFVKSENTYNMANVALVNYYARSNPASADDTVKMGKPSSNYLFWNIDTGPSWLYTIPGPPLNGFFSADDFVIVNSTCQGSPGQPAGVTVRGSPTCD
ncbi:hypothetical protein [Phenylobacterium sp.]|uniref:hypothetical protein n=1 Tax=Phenylobacterium sp. TaxID=1871053 RepID=UPI002FC9CCBF